MRTLVVIPTYQERENIVSVLRRVRSAAPDADVLVVDDGSPDGTAELVLRAAEELGQLEVLLRSRKAGLGTAYRSGIAWGLGAGYERLVMMDADQSHDPDALPKLFAAQEQGADLVIGSRYVEGGSVPDWTIHRRLLSRWGNTYVRLALGLPIKGATSGYRVWTSEALRRVDLLKAQAEGYGFVIESNYAAAKCGLKVAEVPIEFRDRTHGKSKMSLNIIFEALGLVTRWGVQRRLKALRVHQNITRR